MKKKAHKPRYRVNVCAGDANIGIYRMTFIKGRKRVKPYQFTDDQTEVGATAALWVNRNEVCKNHLRLEMAA